MGVLKADAGHRLGASPHVPPADLAMGINSSKRILDILVINLATVAASCQHLGLLGTVSEAGQGAGGHQSVTVLGGVLNVKSVPCQSSNQ